VIAASPIGGRSVSLQISENHSPFREGLGERRGVCSRKIALLIVCCPSNGHSVTPVRLPFCNIYCQPIRYRYRLAHCGSTESFLFGPREGCLQQRDRPRPTQYDIMMTSVSPGPHAGAGFANIVGFELGGVVVLHNGFGVQSFTAIKDFGRDGVPKNAHLVGDATGGETSGVVAFGESGVLASTNNCDNSHTSLVKLILNDSGRNAGTGNLFDI
jgi:hypothetical protein